MVFFDCIWLFVVFQFVVHFGLKISLAYRALQAFIDISHLLVIVTEAALVFAFEWVLLWVSSAIIEEQIITFIFNDPNIFSLFSFTSFVESTFFLFEKWVNLKSFLTECNSFSSSLFLIEMITFLGNHFWTWRQYLYIILVLVNSLCRSYGTWFLYWTLIHWYRRLEIVLKHIRGDLWIRYLKSKLRLPLQLLNYFALLWI